nr:MAG TPA: DNA polymerase II small subunit [Caudoviricetes sp.]
MSQGGVDEYFGVPVEAITARGKTVRLNDGSYEKITYKPGVIERGEVRAKRFEDLAPIFAEAVAAPDAVDGQSTLVVVVSDLQIGKTDRGGGTEGTIRRVRSAVARIADHAAGRYRRVILVDCGDSTEGFSNTVSQAQTNDLPLTYQIRTAQALLADTLRSLAGTAPEVVYVAVPSNHCQVRTGVGRSNRASFPGDDYGLLIADNIREIIDGRPGYRHVQFEVPEKRLESLTVRAADGTVMGVTHGHAAGSKSRVADWFRGQAFGCVAGMQDARVLLHGHWHSFSVQTVGDSRQIICAPTMDPGSSWFQNASGESSQPRLLTFELGGGTSSGWRLWS